MHLHLGYLVSRFQVFVIRNSSDATFKHLKPCPTRILKIKDNPQFSNQKEDMRNPGKAAIVKRLASVMFIIVTLACSIADIDFIVLEVMSKALATLKSERKVSHAHPPKTVLFQLPFSHPVQALPEV